VPRRPGWGQASEYYGGPYRAGSIGPVRSLLLITILLATFLVPAALASDKRPRAALRAVLTAMFFADVAYAFCLRFIYGRLR
jgi:hypothetical protein